MSISKRDLADSFVGVCPKKFTFICKPNAVFTYYTKATKQKINSNTPPIDNPSINAKSTSSSSAGVDKVGSNSDDGAEERGDEDDGAKVGVDDDCAKVRLKFLICKGSLKAFWTTVLATGTLEPGLLTPMSSAVLPSTLAELIVISSRVKLRLL